MRARRTVAILLAVASATAAATLAPAASTPKPVTVRDASGDAASGAPDLVRVQLGRASDGRLRAVLTTAAPFSGADMLSGSGGPPGSACLRVWTVTGSIRGVRADRLVCVTASAEGVLRGTILAPDGSRFQRAGTASVSRASARSLVIRVSRSALGAAGRVRFAAEATKAGCTRPECVDTAPDAPKTATLGLR